MSASVFDLQNKGLHEIKISQALLFLSLLFYTGQI